MTLQAEITVRPDPRWPEGVISRRDTRIIRNARIYLATPDGHVVQVGYGDVGLEQWHHLDRLAVDGLVLVAREGLDAPRPATLEDLLLELRLGLDRRSIMLLGFPDSGPHVLGPLRLPAVAGDRTGAWITERMQDLAELV